MARAAASAFAIALTAAALTPLPGAAADSTSFEGRPIRAIVIVPRNVFDPVPRGSLGSVYALGNRLHLRTRPGTIRRQLLLGRGDPFGARLAAESERALRRLDVLVPDPIRAIPTIPPGDSVDVLVGTRDIWTTAIEFTFESGGGHAAGQVGLVERNLFGMGKSVSATYREDAVRVTRSVGFGDPNLFGTRATLSLSASDESDGSRHGIEVGMPFWAEDASWSAGFRSDRATTLFRLYRDDTEAAVFDRRAEEGEVWFGVGRREHGLVTRLIARGQLIDKRFGPTRLLRSDADAAFEGGEENDRQRRLVLEALWWRPRFVARTGVEQLAGVEDVDLGPRAGFSAGASMLGLGATRNEGYVSFHAGGGAESRGGAYALVRTEASWRFDPQPKEAILRIRARWVRPLGGRGATVVGAWGLLGYDTPRDFQVVLGGLDGLRAFPAQAIAGQRAWRFNAEHRQTLARDAFGVLSVGGAVFYDAGRTWGAGSAGQGWHHDVGFGLRLAVPGSSPSRVARFDVAWPIEPLRHGREPVLSIGSSQAF